MNQETPKTPAPGETAPDFEILDHTGRKVRLSELARERPVILHFYRGDWCPYCRTQLSAYAAAYEELRAAGADFYAMSVDRPSISAGLVKELELPYSLLCDVDKAVSRGWDRFSRFEVGGIAIPTTFVIGTDMTVRYRSLEKMTQRHTPQRVIEFLESGREVEPDHDLDGEPVKPSILAGIVSPFRMLRNVMVRKFG